MDASFVARGNRQGRRFLVVNFRSVRSEERRKSLKKFFCFQSLEERVRQLQDELNSNDAAAVIERLKEEIIEQKDLIRRKNEENEQLREDSDSKLTKIEEKNLKISNLIQV